MMSVDTEFFTVWLRQARARLTQGLFAIMATAGVGLAGEVESKPLVERLLAESANIHTMQCEIRRETELGGKVIRTLSRVWFERPDRLLVETASPEVRRIVVDGKTIYKWINGQPTGVQIPLAEAEEWDLLQVRRVPATANEYLLKLRGLPETALPAQDGFPDRRAYTPLAPHPYTVLSMDETGRLSRLELFDLDVQTNRLLKVDFGGWREVKPGIWIACVQKTEAKGRDGIEVRETLRVGTPMINEPIDPEQFDVAQRIPDVQFIKTDEMIDVLRRAEDQTKNK